MYARELVQLDLEIAYPSFLGSHHTDFFYKFALTVDPPAVNDWSLTQHPHSVSWLLSVLAILIAVK